MPPKAPQPPMGEFISFKQQKSLRFLDIHSTLRWKWPSGEAALPIHQELGIDFKELIINNLE
jgi:hypothetical protein